MAQCVWLEGLRCDCIATVHVAISVVTDGMILGGGFELTMGNKVLDFKLYVPSSFPLALVMYAKVYPSGFSPAAPDPYLCRC